jgi:hypothetical protein
MFATRENRISSLEYPFYKWIAHVVRAWDLGFGLVASWAKLLNVLSTCRNGTGKPSTLMRRHGILLLLLLSIRVLPGLQPGGGYLCEAGCTRWGMPDSLVPGTVSYYPNPRIFGNRLVGVGSVGAPLRVFSSTLQGFESIDCRPLTVIRDCLINWP